MQKCTHLVELDKCCQTHIFLQMFVLIQPRTSPPKICKNYTKNCKLTQHLPILLISGRAEVRDVLAGPRPLLGDELVEEQSEGEDVRALVVGLVPRHFRRHVPGRAHLDHLGVLLCI